MCSRYVTTVLLFYFLISSACRDKERISATLSPPRYDVSDGSQDVVQRLRYELYKKYKVYLITKPETYDYKFNFQRKNQLLITAPRQHLELLKAGVDLLEECFLGCYPEEFKIKHLPFSLILAEQILFLGEQDKTPEYGAFAGRNFVAISGIKEGIDLYTQEEKARLRGEVNARYWVHFLRDVKGVFAVPEEFYRVSEVYYRKNVEAITELGEVSGKNPNEIDYHKLGFVSYNQRTTFYDNDDQAWWIEVPDRETDLRQWIAYLFEKPRAERERVLDAYPHMKEKYEVLKTAFRACEGYDIDLLP